jgi:hypothetical protein
MERETKEKLEVKEKELLDAKNELEEMKGDLNIRLTRLRLAEMEL